MAEMSVDMTADARADRELDSVVISKVWGG